MMIRHALLALLVSYGLSTAFWGLFGVFVLWPFILVSLACALAGAAAGWLAGRRLWLTLAATAVIRTGVFLIAAANG